MSKIVNQLIWIANLIKRSSSLNSCSTNSLHCFSCFMNFLIISLAGAFQLHHRFKSQITVFRCCITQTRRKIMSLCFVAKVKKFLIDDTRRISLNLSKMSKSFLRRWHWNRFCGPSAISASHKLSQRLSQFLFNFHSALCFPSQNLPKSNSQTDSAHETIIKISKLSNCSRSSVASISSSTQNLSKTQQKICCQQPIAPFDHKPLFSSIRHQPELPLNPRLKSDHKVCIVQNFQGISPIVNHCKPPQTHLTASSTDSKMSQDVGSCCAKYILCLFNFVFFVSFTANSSSQIQT